jgi:hypothetical protein
MTHVLYSALKQLGEVEQMLVLAPISAHEAWITEPALMYSPGAAPSLHVGAGRAGAAEVIVTNYERLENRGRLDALVQFCWRRHTLVVRRSPPRQGGTQRHPRRRRPGAVRGSTPPQRADRHPAT